jgi:hypothetical protein
MNPALLAQLERISAAGIELLPVPQISTHFVFTRDGCAVLVERTAAGFGGVGSPGRITAQGFAPLVERNGVKAFVGKGFEESATDAEASAARQLLQDLLAVLAL